MNTNELQEQIAALKMRLEEAQARAEAAIAAYEAIKRQRDLYLAALPVDVLARLMNCV